MAKTRTPGITVLADGRLFIDKRYLGVRIGLRVGAVTQEYAEERLRVEMARIEYEQERKAHARPTFADCAERCSARRMNLKSLVTRARRNSPAAASTCPPFGRVLRATRL